MDTPLRTHVRKVLRAVAAYNAAEAARIKEIEDQGHRIVDGGGEAEGFWDITDWRTGEVLASGSKGYDEYSAAIERLDPDGQWVHIDRIHGDELWDGYDISPTDGIPSSLAVALVDWVENGGTPNEEIAQVAGWSDDEVEQCLREGPAVRGGA